MSQIGQNSSYGFNVAQWRIQPVLCKHEYENYINYGNLHGSSVSLKFSDFYSDIQFFMMYAGLLWLHLNEDIYQLHCKCFIRVSKKRLDNKSFCFIQFTFCNIFIEFVWHFKHIYNYCFFVFFCSVKIQIQNTAFSKPTQQHQGRVLAWASLTISQSHVTERKENDTYRSSRTPLLPSRGEERTRLLQAGMSGLETEMTGYKEKDPSVGPIDDPQHTVSGAQVFLKNWFPNRFFMT